jgi:hypothetical protein
MQLLVIYQSTKLGIDGSSMSMYVLSLLPYNLKYLHKFYKIKLKIHVGGYPTIVFLNSYLKQYKHGNRVNFWLDKVLSFQKLCMLKGLWKYVAFLNPFLVKYTLSFDLIILDEALQLGMRNFMWHLFLWIKKYQHCCFRLLWLLFDFCSGSRLLIQRTFEM